MTATAERSRLETLRAKEAELSTEREVVRERLAGYPEKIAAERREAWYAKPSKRPLTQLNSPLQKLIDADAKDAKTLTGLEADLSAVRGLIAQEDAKVREQETAEARAQLERQRSSEETIWQEAGSLIAGLASCWNSYVDQVEQSSRVARVNGLEGSALAVSPPPDSFRSWLLLLLSVATDADVRAEPHVVEMTETGIYGNAHGGASYETRPAGIQTTEVRRRLDEHDRLFHLIPDLRAVVRKLE